MEADAIKSWLQPVDSWEMRTIKAQCITYYMNQCFFKNTAFSSIASSVENRIIGGGNADAKVWNFVAVLVSTSHNLTHCTATFISPRHLLTNRHCFYHEDNSDTETENLLGKNRPILYAGGRCYAIDERSGCEEVDMLQLNYTFVFFDNDLSSRLIAKDLAIIQLAEEVPANSNIGFACLACDPKSNLAIEMTVLGLDTLNATANGKARKCEYSSEDAVFCTYTHSHADNPFTSNSMGDSGGPVAITFKHGNNQRAFIVEGITKGSRSYWLEPNRTGREYFINYNIKIAEFHDDFCFYLGICWQGQKNITHSKILKLTSASIPGSHTQEFGAIAPFRYSYQNYVYYMEEYCAKDEKIELRGQPSEELIGYGWGARETGESDTAHLYFVSLIEGYYDVEDPVCSAQFGIPKQPLYKNDYGQAIIDTTRTDHHYILKPKVIGMFYTIDEEEPNSIKIVRIRPLLDVLCTYLNRCDVDPADKPDNGRLLVNPIPKFDRIYRNDD
uniref:Peptidase S1 domain-containing protein n=1 Tax=Ditylenchus dipsaci TaxID=166011 RepID=A0A915E339_9BILA